MPDAENPPKRQKTTDQSDVSKPPERTDSGEHKKEVGGRKGPEPTRFGDWERKGICVDF